MFDGGGADPLGAVGGELEGGGVLCAGPGGVAGDVPVGEGATGALWLGTGAGTGVDTGVVGTEAVGAAGDDTTVALPGPYVPGSFDEAVFVGAVLAGVVATGAGVGAAGVATGGLGADVEVPEAFEEDPEAACDKAENRLEDDWLEDDPDWVPDRVPALELGGMTIGAKRDPIDERDMSACPSKEISCESTITQPDVASS